MHFKSYVACLNGKSIIFIALQLGGHHAIFAEHYQIILILSDFQIGRLKSHKSDATHTTILSVDESRLECAWLTRDILNVSADKSSHGLVARELY